jgi:hypothetical protein
MRLYSVEVTCLQLGHVGKEIRRERRWHQQSQKKQTMVFIEFPNGEQQGRWLHELKLIKDPYERRVLAKELFGVEVEDGLEHHHAGS